MTTENPATGPRRDLEPVCPPLRDSRPSEKVQAALRADRIPPPRTLLYSSDFTLGVEPVDAARYHSQAFADLEVERMWSKVWQYACWGFDLANPGDISVYRNAGRSVLIVRQRDGSLKAFVNSCLHRGRELCTEDTKQQQLRCPYHAFTWSLDGALRWIPAKWDFPQIEFDEFRLPEVRVAQWNGFVFVNFDPQAPTLEAYMGAMVGQWRDWDFTKRYKAVHVEKRVNCNWKVAQEGMLENLHVYATHPQAAAISPTTMSQYDVYPDEPHFSRFHNIAGLPNECLDPEPSDQVVLDGFTSTYLPEAFDTPTGQLQPGETPRQAIVRLSRAVYRDRMGLDVSSLPDSEVVDGTEYLLFPNFLPWPSLANPIVYRFRPGATPDWCIWETMLFLPFEGERPPSAPIIRLGPEDSMEDVEPLGYLRAILQQDAVQMPAVQRGLKASATQKVELSKYQEVRIRHFHQTLGRYVNGKD